MLSIQKGTLNLFREDETISYEVGYCFIGGDILELLELTYLLSEDERNRYIGFKYPLRGLSYLLGRLSSKIAIEQLDNDINPQNISIVNGVFGFPVVKGNSKNIQVNYSHSDNIGVSLAYYEEYPIGIDIEKIDFDKISIIKSYMTEREIQMVKDIDLEKEGAFFLWTMKESLSKIIKTGLTLRLDVLEIQSIKKLQDNIWESSFVNFTQYKIISGFFNDHICSITIPRKTNFSYDEFISFFLSYHS